MKRPLRIVLVSFEYPPQYGGGIGVYAAAMARTLAARGHGVTVITVTEDSFPAREDDGGVEVVRLPLPRGLPEVAEPQRTLQYWSAHSAAVAAYLRRMIAAERVDVIEFADYRAEASAFIGAPGEPRPVGRPATIIRLHTPLAVLNKYNSDRARLATLEALELDAMRSADALVSPSAALAREVRAAAPDLPEIEVVPNPADPGGLDLAAAPRRGDDVGSDDILYVGRLEQRKGVRTLIEAAPAILRACPGATIHLIGGDTPLGPGEPSVRAVLEREIPAWARPRIIMHGPLPRERTLERYRRARVCVFPSLFENFPNVCLEAMALERPVVGASNSGMAEMIEDGVSGVLARSGDAADLAAKVISLWNAPLAARRAMGEAARRRILAAYHPDVVAEQWEDLARRTMAKVGGADAAAPPRPARVRAGEKPAVAVVIPCFNHGRYVGEALASVRAQTWPRVEPVIVDDGSTDPETIRVLDGLATRGVRVIRQENGGLAAARNTGVRATDAPFYVPLDADDIIDPTFVETLIAPLLEDPTLGYSYCHAAYFGDGAPNNDVWPCPAYDPATLLVANLSTATAVVRRAAFDLAGGYAEDMRGGMEDWDFWIALLAVGYRGRCTPRPLFRYRKHAGGSMLTETQKRRRELYHRIVSHHRHLFALNLENATAEKDIMFFRSHMEAWQTRVELERVLGGGVTRVAANGHMSAAAPEVVVRARAELEELLRSRAWRMVQRVRGSVVYRAYARARFGEGWDRGLDLSPDPCESLDTIKRTRTYRVIQAIRSTPVYRWYAARRAGA